LSNTAKAPTSQAKGTRTEGRPVRAVSNTVAYSLTPAPAAIRCAWCDHVFDRTDRHFTARVQCSKCGVATTSPWPSDEQLAEAYGGWYRPDSGRFSGLGDKVLRRLRATLAGQLDPKLPPGPVLDVGAGDGNLVEAFIRHGREALGLEPYGSGPHIRQAEIEEMDGTWSAVIFWHSLEHLRDPAGALEHAASLLAPEGKLVVAVPNAASLQARAFGDRWFALDLPRHLVHLNPSALISKIEDAGLQVERVSYKRGGQIVFGWVHGLVGLLPGHPDLYDVIRRSEAQSAAQSSGRRLLALAAAVVALPTALVAAVIEVALRSGGTVYVQACREPAPEQAS
jgi:2-polyprenyl-3-methyl-5-hydroxy-6-metoxy-1,4-benzoquinol methylase